MRCLSICQPWATLVILGVKRFETRSWSTRHRGPLAIHASKTFRDEARLLFEQEPFRTELLKAGFRSSADLPRGMILGTVELIACLGTADLVTRGLIDAREAAFGDYSAGRYAFELRAPKPLQTPLRWSGQLNLFEIPDPDPQTVG